MFGCDTLENNLKASLNILRKLHKPSWQAIWPPLKQAIAHLHMDKKSVPNHLGKPLLPPPQCPYTWATFKEKASFGQVQIEKDFNTHTYIWIRIG